MANEPRNPAGLRIAFLDAIQSFIDSPPKGGVFIFVEDIEYTFAREEHFQLKFQKKNLPARRALERSFNALTEEQKKVILEVAERILTINDESFRDYVDFGQMGAIVWDIKIRTPEYIPFLELHNLTIAP